MHASRTVGRTYCTKTIIHISQNKRGVAATLAYTYIGLTYVNNVVATIVYRYYFMINMLVRKGVMSIITQTDCWMFFAEWTFLPCRSLNIQCFWKLADSGNFSLIRSCFAAAHITSCSAFPGTQCLNFFFASQSSWLESACVNQSIKCTI